MGHVDWKSYAQVYDLMASNNPAYLDIVANLEVEMESWELGPGARILDLASGTGNFSLPLARAFPQSLICSVDADPAMNGQTRRKAAAEGLININVFEGDLEVLDFEPGSISAIVCVHALYTLSDPFSLIRKARTWLKPGGYLFVCDLGRTLDLGDWSRYLFHQLRARHGLAKTLTTFFRGRAVARQNRRIARAQRNRAYWTHTHAEFRAPFEEAGFDISRSSSCYRGYSDLIVARNPAWPRQISRAA